jgi:hypothetical protein
MHPAVSISPTSNTPSPNHNHSRPAKPDVPDFVSSANFTDAGQLRNIGVGLLVTSRSLAEKLVAHFETMVSEGLLQPAIW